MRQARSANGSSKESARWCPLTLIVGFLCCLLFLLHFSSRENQLWLWWSFIGISKSLKIFLSRGICPFWKLGDFSIENSLSQIGICPSLLWNSITAFLLTINVANTTWLTLLTFNGPFQLFPLSSLSLTQRSLTAFLLTLSNATTLLSTFFCC